MRGKRSLIQIYLISLLMLAVIPVAIIGYIWFASEYERFTEQSQNWRDTFVESRHELLRREVNKATEYIDYKRSQLNRRLYQELRQEVAVGLSLIGNVHTQYAKTESREQILVRVRDILEPLRFHNRKGFFFALGGDGQSLLAPLHPQNRQRLSHSGRLTAFARQVEQATEGKKQNFLAFKFKQDDALESGAERNLSFVYYYEPLDLYVGASVYLRDEIDRIQQEVVDRLGAVPYDPESSVLFVSNLRGEQVVNPYSPEQLGKPMAGMAPFLASLENGQVDEQGQLLELQWSRQGESAQSPVLSYVRADKEWGWIIGAGFFLDEFNAMIAEERKVLQERVRGTVMFIAFIACGLMLLAAVVARWLAGLNAKVFRTFQEFFAEASKRSTRINVEELPFAEFIELAEDANYMVETRSDTERALKLSERRFQLALFASQNHLWDLDVETGLISIGADFYRDLGYPPPEENTDISIFANICHPNDYEILKEVMGSWETQATGVSIEFRVKDHKGNYHWILTRGDVVESDAQGKPLRAMGIMNDITQRKRMEQELVTARIAAEDANHAKSQFLSSVSHELRTPLNGVLGYAQLLQRQKELPGKSRDYLGAIESCGQHLLNLINDVLDLAKIESGNLNIEYHSVSISEVLSSVGDIVRQRAEAKGLEYRLNVASEVPDRFKTDEVKLRQVLVNLLDNAVKFTNSGFIALTLSVDDDAEFINFTVQDTGIGIPREKLREIFEPFRQVNPNDGKGTGLGLAITRRLCEAMGGELHLDSELGKGSTFYVSLPLREAQVDTGDRPLHSLVEEAPLAALPSDLSIIVADDNQVNREVIVGMLQPYTRRIREAVNGREVLQLLELEPAQLVLMDLRMPEMDGLEATRHIKSNPDMRDTVVVMVSASAGQETIEQSRKAGCEDFVAKPVQLRELLDTIGRYFEPGDSAVAVESNSNGSVANNGTRSQGVSLPDEVRLRLLDLLSVGDIAAMDDELNRLGEADENYRATAEQGKQMLVEFDFESLKQLLKA